MVLLNAPNLSTELVGSEIPFHVLVSFATGQDLEFRTEAKSKRS